MYKKSSPIDFNIALAGHQAAKGDLSSGNSKKLQRIADRGGMGSSIAGNMLNQQQAATSDNTPGQTSGPRNAGMSMMGQVGANSVFGGPRQLDVESLQYPYSGAMTRMDQGAIDKSNQMFGTPDMRQYGMNMSGPLNKMLPSPEENPGVNKLPSGVQKKMGYTEDSSGNPLMKTPDFSGRTFKSLEGESVQTADLSKAFLSGAFGTEAENTTAAQENQTANMEDASTFGLNEIPQPKTVETPQSLRQAERVENTKARIARRKARKEERGGGTRVGNFLRKTFN